MASVTRHLNTASEEVAEVVAEASKPKRRKKKNLFDVAQFLPNWGIGYKMAKSSWRDVSYQITKINLYKDGRHGKAWGLDTKPLTLEKHTHITICGTICQVQVYLQTRVTGVSVECRVRIDTRYVSVRVHDPQGSTGAS
ncbi:hypothetical protein KSP40_PGU013904 [Platanthera guangdongensis]|uniref:Uncharacterized protein n=1 Tax=Platanthera guangdongensis TaxID=2320717 RepID=A0ABR2MCD3_9ASPA